MGGYDYDRHKGIEGLTLAGLMMFGKGTPIENVFLCSGWTIWTYWE